MKPNEYARYDGLGLAQLVRTRQVSPRELAEVARAAIDAVNPKINTVIAKIADWEARVAQAPAGAPFAGVRVPAVHVSRG